jgi:hydroxymethylbilane synthase
MPIRGNVPTRLDKLAKFSQEEPYDATILAAAGLRRLGHDLSSGRLIIHGVTLWLETLDWMLPAPGQGAIAVETRNDDPAMEWVQPLHDAVTFRCITAERLVLKHLGGGCHLALGAHATESSGILSLRAVFIADAHAEPLSAHASAATPEEVARRVADQLLSQ